MKQQRTLVIFRDCHKKNNLVINIKSDYEERFYRNFAHRMGWPCCIRKPKQHSTFENHDEIQVWRKPSIWVRRTLVSIGAFNLKLTPMVKEGGAA